MIAGAGNNNVYICDAVSYTHLGFGSWLECARMVGSGSAAYGQGWEMDAIAACVVGGVSFTGGIGKISGCLLYTSPTATDW